MNTFEFSDQNGELTYWQELGFFLVGKNIGSQQISHLGNLLILNNPKSLKDMEDFVNNNLKYCDDGVLFAHIENDVLSVNNVGVMGVYIFSSENNNLVDISGQSGSYYFDKNSILCVSSLQKMAQDDILHKSLLIKLANQSPKHNIQPLHVPPQPSSREKAMNLVSLHSKKMLTAILLLMLLSAVIWSVFLKRPQRLRSTKEEKISVFLNNQKGKIHDQITKNVIPKIKEEDEKDLMSSVGLFSNSINLSDSERELLSQKVQDMIYSELGFVKIVPKVFFDVSSIATGVEAKYISTLKKDVFIFDEKNKSIYLINENKSSKIYPNKDLENTLSIAPTRDRVAGLTKNGLIWHFSGGETKTYYQLPTETYTSLLPVLGIFGEKHFVVKNNGEIDRIALENDVASISAYITSEVPVASQDTLSIGIDGFVYIATKADVYKLSKGVLEKEYRLGLEKGDRISKLLVPFDDKKPLLVWFSDVGKIVGVKKNGGFDFQTVMPELKNANDIFYDESRGLLFILKDNKVLTASLL